MTNILSTIINNFQYKPVSHIPGVQYIFRIDGDPSLLTADIPISSLAIEDNNGVHGMYMKVGPTSADWVKFMDQHGAVPAKFSGLFRTLNTPLTAEMVAENLDKQYRPTFTLSPLAETIYVEASGDDVNGDGKTVGTAFATFKRAIQLVPTLNGKESIRTISIGPGQFELPSVIEANYTDVVGANSVLDTFTVASVIANSVNTGIVVEVLSGAGPYLAGELRGTLVKWTTGASAGKFGWIYRSEATDGLGVTRIHCTQDAGGGNGLNAIGAFDQISLLSTDTTLVYPEQTATMQDSVQLNISNCRLASSAANWSKLFILTTDKIEFKNCIFDGSTTYGGTLRTVQIGGFGRSLLTNCYYACAGSTTDAMLALKNNGFLQLSRGTVIDAINAVGSAKRVDAISGSLLAFRDLVVCRDFTFGTIFRVDGLGIYPVKGLTATDAILIEDGNGLASSYQVGPVFNINSSGEGLGGWYQLPNIHGTVSSPYVLEAQRFAYVDIGASSTITSAIGLLAVSANGGLTPSSISSDLTYIRNGIPTANGFSVKHSQTFVAADLVAGVITFTHNLSSQFVNISIYDNLNTLMSAVSVTAINQNQVTVDLTGLVITGIWNVNINS